MDEINGCPTVIESGKKEAKSSELKRARVREIIYKCI